MGTLSSTISLLSISNPIMYVQESDKNLGVTLGGTNFSINNFFHNDTDTYLLRLKLNLTRNLLQTIYAFHPWAFTEYVTSIRYPD